MFQQLQPQYWCMHKVAIRLHTPTKPVRWTACCTPPQQSHLAGRTPGPRGTPQTWLPPAWRPPAWRLFGCTAPASPLETGLQEGEEQSGPPAPFASSRAAVCSQHRAPTPPAPSPILFSATSMSAAATSPMTMHSAVCVWMPLPASTTSTIKSMICGKAPATTLRRGRQRQQPVQRGQCTWQVVGDIARRSATV